MTIYARIASHSSGYSYWEMRKNGTIVIKSWNHYGGAYTDFYQNPYVANLIAGDTLIYMEEV